jgi:KAP family P-loop domain
MKITPPKAIIDEKDPFAHALFGRKEFAESLTNLLQNVEESLVIFINASWGEGKTTFSEMWRAWLKQQSLEVIYFDAYASDYFDDPFVSFSGEIIDLADKHLPGGKELAERREFKETAIEVGKRLASLVAKVGLRAITLNAVEAADLQQLNEIASGISEIGADVIEKEIDNYTKEKDALAKFKESLTKLAVKVREKQNFPLTIIVDELDRCRPDFALGLLERIKHLFDVDGVAFVLLVNREQIEGYIRTVYGNADAESYLLKFGSLFIDLPKQQPVYSLQYQKGVKDYCRSLVNYYGFPAQFMDFHFFATSMGIFAEHFDLTLREIEKAFSITAVYFSSLKPSRFSNRFENEWLVALLSILKVKRQNLFDLLVKGNVSVKQFYKETNLDRLKPSDQSFNWERMKALLDYYLMSDDELKEATESENDGNRDLRQISRDMRANRTQMIPFLCSGLNRFSLKPK